MLEGGVGDNDEIEMNFKLAEYVQHNKKSFINNSNKGHKCVHFTNTANYYTF